MARRQDSPEPLARMLLGRGGSINAEVAGLPEDGHSFFIFDALVVLALKVSVEG